MRLKKAVTMVAFQELAWSNFTKLVKWIVD